MCPSNMDLHCAGCQMMPSAVAVSSLHPSDISQCDEEEDFSKLEGWSFCLYASPERSGAHLRTASRMASSAAMKESDTGLETEPFLCALHELHKKRYGSQAASFTNYFLFLSMREWLAGTPGWNPCQATRTRRMSVGLYM